MLAVAGAVGGEVTGKRTVGTGGTGGGLQKKVSLNLYK